MNSDIRISTSLPNHPKTRRLIRKLGSEGFTGLIFLMCGAGDHRPKGRFHGMSDADVEDLAGWRGEPGKLIQALLDVDEEGEFQGFLERDEEGVLFIHDWEEWNSWAFKAPERRAHAKMMAERRWGKRLKAAAEKGDEEPKKPTAKGKGAKKKTNGSSPPVQPEVLEDGDAKGPTPMMVMNSWNRVCVPRGMSQASRLGPSRRAKLSTRLKDKGWNWQGAINWIENHVPTLEDVRAGKAPLHFLSGGGRPMEGAKDPWVATFDWFIRSEVAVTKILENAYGDKSKNLPSTPDAPSGRTQAMQRALSEGEEWAGEGDG